MVFKDYYKILGIQTNSVNFDTIKIAFRDLAKKYHPDVNVGNIYAEERFKDINEAYQVLTNNASKRKYDRIWTAHVGNKHKFNSDYKQKNTDKAFSDFFNMFFGETKEEKRKIKAEKVPIKGENIETEVSVSILESFYGMEKKIALRTSTGNMKTFIVKVPEGIRNGEKIRFQEQGKPGINGGSNGDMFIKIKIADDEKFKLNGSDVHTDLCLSPWEAALGARINMESIDGGVVVHVPPSIESGEKIRISKKGYKDGKGGRGDLIAEVKIMVPKNPTEKEVKLFKELNKISEFNARTMRKSSKS